MDKKVAETLAGTMGHFWIDLATFPEVDMSWPGHAVHQGRYFVIRVIKRPAESFDLPGHQEIPEAVYGMTEFGGVAAYDIRSNPENSVWGGHKISVRSYLARGLAVGVSPDDLASAKLASLTADFHGLARWSGAPGGKVENEKYADGRLEGIKYTTRRVTPVQARVSKGRTVEMGVSWSANYRQFDQFSATTPLTFTVTKSRPGAWMDLIGPIMSFQDLVNLAHNAFVPCVGGLIIPHHKRGTEVTKASLWSNTLMDIPSGVERASEDSTIEPVFTFGAIGGIEGVKRWILLAENHPRAVGPLTKAHRLGLTTIEVELMNIAVAIEYWVGACKKASKRRPKWTMLKNINYAEKLAKHVGSQFREFVGGDELRWGRLFWDRYTALKHDPLVSYDGYELYILMRSGRILLMCALLNRIANSKKPAQWICNSHHYYNLSQETKELLQRNPKLFRR